MFKKVRVLFVLILSVNLVSITAAQSGRVRPRESSSGPSSSVRPLTPAAQNVIPKGTVIELRLNQSLSSKTNTKGEEFFAPVSEPVFVKDRLVVTPNTPVKCHIISVEPAKRNRNNGSLTIAFDEISIDGQKIILHATLVSIAEKSDEVLDEEREGKIKDPKKSKNAPVTIGTSAGIGATIGAIGGAPGGAIGGGAIGAGVGLGSILLSKGQDVNLLSGTRLQIRLDSELKLPEQIGTEQKSN